MSLSQVTVVIVNHETECLVRDAVETFLEFYPVPTMILFDNGSTHDGSASFMETFALTRPTIQFVGLDRNVGHGPALNLCTLLAKTKYVFALDSDTRTIQGGFLELMLEKFEENPLLFALGWLRYCNIGGVPYRRIEDGRRRGYKYIHPSAMMFDREKYWGLASFKHAGSPAAALMVSAADAGYHLDDFPIPDYIEHLGWGTRRIYGGKWDPKATAKLEPVEWVADAWYPI